MMNISLWPEERQAALGAENAGCPSLRLYPATGSGRKALMIVCPGGGYRMRADHEGGPVAEWLNGLGISAAVLNYRVSPYRHPIPLEDVQRAVRMARDRAEAWSIDGQRIGVLGFSAGGHLAACAGTLFDAGNEQASDPIDRHSSRPDALVLCYPVITMGEGANEFSRRHLLGDTPDASDIARLSLERQVTAHTPPAFLWHTADDAAVPAANSLRFAEALGRCGVPYELHVFASGVHGLGLAPEHAEAGRWPELCAAWLGRQGFL